MHYALYQVLVSSLRFYSHVVICQIWSRLLAISSPVITINAFRKWKSDCRQVEVPRPLESVLCGPEGRSLWTASLGAKTAMSTVVSQSTDQPPPLSWPCGVCGHTNGASKSKCSVCQTKGAPWVCPMCHTRNKVNHLACSKCSISKHASPVVNRLAADAPANADAPAAGVDNNASVSLCIMNATSDVTVSSNTPSADKLFSPFTHWESSGSSPHWIEVIIPGENEFMHDMTITVKDHGTYSPRKVKISCVALPDFLALKDAVKDDSPQYCSSGCNDDHSGQMCSLCNQSWGVHAGHNCPGGGGRGKFPLNGGSGGREPLLEKIRRKAPSKVCTLNQLSLDNRSYTETLVSADRAMPIRPKLVLIEVLDNHQSGSNCRVGGIRIQKTYGSQTLWLCPGCKCVGDAKRFSCRMCSAARPKIGAASMQDDSVAPLSMAKRRIARMVTTHLVSKYWERKELDFKDDNKYIRKWHIRGTSQSNVMWASPQRTVFFSIFLDDSEIVLNSGLPSASGEKRVPIPPLPFECDVQCFPTGFLISGVGLKYLYVIPGFDGTTPSMSFSTPLEAECAGEIACSKIGPGQEAVVTDVSDDSEDDDDDSVDADVVKKQNARDTAVNLELLALPDEFSVVDMPCPPKLEMQSSVMFWKQGHFEGIESLTQLCQWKDKDGSSAAHHAAFTGLWKSLKALWSAGVSKWTLNKRGESSLGLACGLRGPARNFMLFKFCFKRQLLDGDAVFQVGMCPPMTAAALRCPESFDSSAPMIGLIADLRNGRAEEALETISDMQEGAEGPLSLTLYKALAMLQAGYGDKACSYELGHYIEELLAMNEDAVLDPLYFYIVYCMWKNSFSKSSRQKVVVIICNRIKNINFML
jgi:hypothetical protein